MIPLYHRNLMNARCLKNVLRLWSLRGAGALHGEDPRPRFGAGCIAVIALACSAVWVWIDRWEAGPGAQFFRDNVPLFAWYGLGAVCLAGLLYARVQRRTGIKDLIALVSAWVPLPLLLAALA